MESTPNPHSKTNKIKELQVLSITRQDFDDSTKQTDSGGVFIQPTSISNKSFEPFCKPNPLQKKSQKNSQQLLPRMDSIPGLNGKIFFEQAAIKLRFGVMHYHVH